MVRSRTLVVAAATAALALGALAAPAAAANPRIAVVNGIPGKTVDVCLGNNEIKSRLRYGAWSQHTTTPGSRVVRFRNAAPGNCKGSLLGSENINLIADDDLTLVGTKLADKVILWDNMLPPAPIGPVNYWHSIRHAADVGNVVFAFESDSVVSALPNAFVKGQEDRETGPNFDSFWLSATRLDQAEPMVVGHFQAVEGRRLEIILVGSKSSNARFVAIYRSKLAP